MADRRCEPKQNGECDRERDTSVLRIMSRSTLTRSTWQCHGDEQRFEAVASFIYEYYGKSIRYIADVAGGQGLLARLLCKKYNYEAEVIDPRGYTLKGVASRACVYTPDMAEYYDLIVGLHPDEALRPVVESALIRPVLAVPCCNHWDASRKLGTKALLEAVCDYLSTHSIAYETVVFGFKGPKNIGIVTKPAAHA